MKINIVKKKKNLEDFVRKRGKFRVIRVLGLKKKLKGRSEGLVDKSIYYKFGWFEFDFMNLCEGGRRELIYTYYYF